MLPAWNNAKVAEPSGVSETASGAITFDIATPTIFSLDPAKDFEINTNVVKNWQLIFMSDTENLGTMNYFTALEKLQPYILDQENGSILIKNLTAEDVEKLLS